ncbi:MAG: DUF4391 domain-containing protein [Erysipelotrichaceae bacterium]
MFEFNNEYKINKRLFMKDFIPKSLSPDIKKKIKDNLLKVTLLYQIAGDETPSIINNEYNYQVIQLYDFEVKDIKKASFLGSIYQDIIKSPCIIHIHDQNKEIYSLALKRLNRQDQSEIIVTDKLLTSTFSFTLPDTKKQKIKDYISFEHIVNKNNKLSYYKEVFVKLYILENLSLYSKIKESLDKPLWYDDNKVENIFNQIKLLETNKQKLSKTITNAEKVKINKEIKLILQRLEVM